MKKITLLLSLLLILASFGCQSNPKLNEYDKQVDEEISLAMKVPVYFWDRFLDLTDIVQVDLAFGDGFLFNLHSTKWMQVGAGYRDGVCFGFLPRSFGMWYEDRTEGGVAFLPIANMYWKNIKREALWGSTTLFDHDVEYKGVDHMSKVGNWHDLGVSLHLAVIGADVTVSPFQAFDFVLGFFGMPFLIPIDPIGFGSEIDVANDDVRARKVRNDSAMPYYNYPLNPQLKD